LGLLDRKVYENEGGCGGDRKCLELSCELLIKLRECCMRTNICNQFKLLNCYSLLVMEEPAQVAHFVSKLQAKPVKDMTIM
jgi:hypothetical protein